MYFFSIPLMHQFNESPPLLEKNVEKTKFSETQSKTRVVEFEFSWFTDELN